MPNTKVEVHIFEILHEGPAEVAQEFFNEHGVKIHNVSFEWSTTVGGEDKVLGIKIETSRRAD